MPAVLRRHKDAKRKDITGTVVAVTGGAQGIGFEIARALADAGATVAIGDLDPEAAATAAQRIGARATGSALDVTGTASFTAFLDRVEDSLGPIDVLVNNAGVMWVGPYDAETDEAASRQVEVNLLGVIRGTRLAAPRMVRRGHGQILTIASAASKLAPAGESTYAATKHGVHGYLSGVRQELRGTGVAISMILPGVVDTELAAGTRTGPVRRLKPQDVAAAVVRTVRKPRFETVIPAQIGILHKLVAVLPDALRRPLLIIFLPNQVKAVSAERNGAVRQGYESTHFSRSD